MGVSLLFKKPYDGLPDVKFRPGEFGEINDDALVAALVDAGVAEKKTRDEAQFERMKAESDARIADLQKMKLEHALRVSKPGSLEDQDPKGGFKSAGHFLHDIFRAGPRFEKPSEPLYKWVNRKAAGTDEMREDLATAGGVLVPPEFQAKWLQNALEKSVAMPRATPVPMQTNTISVPYVNETSRATTTHGGITIAARTEVGQMSGSKPAGALCTLTLHELYGLCYVTNSLIEDSPISLEPIIGRMFGDALAFKADSLYFSGSGAGEPQGILNANCGVPVAKETGQLAATIVYENIVNMYSRMWPEGHANAVWVANHNCFPQLALMGVKVGTGGSTAYLPPTGAAGAPFGTLLGRPLLLTEKCITLGTVGDIMYVDFSQCLLGNKGGINSAVSIHLRFDYAETAFRFQLRHDFQPWWSSAVTPLNGSTLSPIIKLATRS